MVISDVGKDIVERFLSFDEEEQIKTLSQLSEKHLFMMERLLEQYGEYLKGKNDL